MTSGQNPDDRHLSDTTDDSKRKLAIWLAGLTLVLVILLVVFFTWWSREGEETEDEDVMRIELIRQASTVDQYIAA
jgi:hypothetical protein